MPRLLPPLVLAFVLVALPSCSWFGTEKYSDASNRGSLDSAGKLIPSGFLKDYSKLEMSEHKEGAYVYTNPSKRLSLYKMVIIEPVKVIPHKESQLDEVHSKQAEEMAHRFEMQLKSMLEDSFPIVNAPGFGVLRIRTAITDIRANAPLNPVSNVTGLGLGGASMEAEFIDSLTGEQVAAFVDSESGKGHRRSASLSRFGQAEDRLAAWAVLFRDRMDEIRGLHKSSDFRAAGNRWK
jgi:hypothetical protein